MPSPRFFIDVTIRDDSGRVQRGRAVYVQPLGADPTDRGFDVPVFVAQVGPTLATQPLISDLHGQLTHSVDLLFWVDPADLQVAWQDRTLAWHVKPCTIGGLGGIVGEPDPTGAIDLDEFGPLDPTGVADVLPTWQSMADYCHDNVGATIKIPIGIHRWAGELDVVDATQFSWLTYNWANTIITKDAGLSGRVFDIDASGAASFESYIGKMSYKWKGDPIDSLAAFRFGNATKCVIDDAALRAPTSALHAAAGGVLFDDDSDNCTMGRMFGNIDFARGGWLVDNRGGVGVIVLPYRINGINSGAQKGGGLIRIMPPAGSGCDGGTYWTGYAQGSNCEGPDRGLLIDGTLGRAINNQRIMAMTLDHCYRYELEVVALPGSNCKARAIKVFMPRMTGDGPCSYKVDWNSSNPLQLTLNGDPRMTFRAAKRPFFFSSAPNTVDLRIRDPEASDGSASTVANDKVLFNLGLGRFKINGFVAGTGAAPTPSYIKAGGEAFPYYTEALIVDANQGTYDLHETGGASALALAYNLSAAALETALAGLGGGNIRVEGGPGGPFGPLRTRLSATYTIGDAIMHLQEIPVGAPATGTVALSGSGNIAYTGISGLTLTGCSGGTGGPYTGTPVVRWTASTGDDDDDNPEGGGSVYYLIRKGTATPNATQSPGYNGMAAPLPITVDSTNLGGSGEVGGGLGKAMIDVISHGCPLNNYDSRSCLWGVAAIEKTIPTADDFLDPLGVL